MKFLAQIFRRLSGTLQWYVLWFAHAKFIVGVSGVVLDDNGSVLLLRHRFWKEGSWGLPSGYAIKQESLVTALAREIREETGLEIQVVGLLRVVSGYRLRIELSFLAKLVGGTLEIDDREILEARFFPLSELPVGVLTSHRQLLEKVESFRGETSLETI